MYGTTSAPEPLSEGACRVSGAVSSAGVVWVTELVVWRRSIEQRRHQWPVAQRWSTHTRRTLFTLKYDRSYNTIKQQLTEISRPDWLSKQNTFCRILNSEKIPIPIQRRSNLGLCQVVNVISMDAAVLAHSHHQPTKQSTIYHSLLAIWVLWVVFQGRRLTFRVRYSKIKQGPGVQKN